MSLEPRTYTNLHKQANKRKLCCITLEKQGKHPLSYLILLSIVITLIGNVHPILRVRVMHIKSKAHQY